MSTDRTFLDQSTIFIKAGDGGNGHVGFHRAKFKPKGGPNGGDGGKGGGIIFVGSIHLTTLEKFRFKKHYRAQNGKPGGPSQKNGAAGENMYVNVPLGTLVYCHSTGELKGEILKDQEQFTMMQGGRGGLGNMNFATSTNQAPRKFTPGGTTEGEWIRLELRLLADIGIVGLPNAGKSTLLSSLTEAKPKIANYPFTTLSPVLGVISKDEKPLTLADMPGLIKDAHQGVGLGIEFLRHIQRTHLLLYIVAADPTFIHQAWNDFQITKNEILKYDPNFRSKPFLVAINKIDLLKSTDLDTIKTSFTEKGIQPLFISAKEKIGLSVLIDALYAQYHSEKSVES